MAASVEHTAIDGLPLQQVAILINQSVVATLNIRILKQTTRVWAELKEVGRDYGEWTYGTLRDGDFTCGVRIPTTLAQTLMPGQTGWWTGTFEAPIRRDDGRQRMSQYDAWRFVTRTFEAQGVSERLVRLQEAERVLTHEGILPHATRSWPNDLLPWRLALIGQPQSKGWEDVTIKLMDNPAIEIHQIPVNLGQATSIVAGIQQAGQEQCHAILVVRGGGDLDTFDEPAIVRALAQSPIYTIAGIGHASDRVLVNAAVDYAATTPTDAALFVLQHLEKRYKQAAADEMAQQNQALQQKLDEMVQQRQDLQQQMATAANRNMRFMWWIIGMMGLIILALGGVVWFKG